MQKTKKQNKQLKSFSNPIPQSYISNVSNIFMHPSQLIYIIIDTDNYLRIYDIPTMSLIGKSCMKTKQGYQIYKVLFNKYDIGLFYTLCRCVNQSNNKMSQNQYNVTKLQQINEGQNIRKIYKKIQYTYIINMHYLNKNSQILWSTCQIDLNQYLQGHPQIQYQVKMEKQILFDENIKYNMNKSKQNQKDNQIMNNQLQGDENMVQEKIEQPQPQKQKQEQVEMQIQIQKQQAQQILKQNEQIKNENENMKDIQQNQKDNEIMEEKKPSRLSSNNEHENSSILFKKVSSRNKSKKKDSKQLSISNKSQISKMIQSQYQKTQPLQILQISKYIRNSCSSIFSSQYKSSQSMYQLYYTILTTNGLHICSLKQQIAIIQLQNIQIITGINVYGNLNGYILNNNNIQNENTKYKYGQFNDLWIIFSQNNCILLQTEGEQYNNIMQNRRNKNMIQQNNEQNQQQQQQQQQQNQQQQYSKFYSEISVKINKNYYKKPKYTYIYNNNNNQYQQNIPQIVQRQKQLCIEVHKKIIPILSQQNQIVLISYITYNTYKLSIVGKIKLDSIIANININININTNLNTNININNNNNILDNGIYKIINYITVMRFGVNTSTTNKYENKVIIIVGLNNGSNIVNTINNNSNISVNTNNNSNANANMNNNNTTINVSMNMSNIADMSISNANTNQIGTSNMMEAQKQSNVKKQSSNPQEDNKLKQKQKQKQKQKDSKNKTNIDAYIYSLQLNPITTESLPSNIINLPSNFSSLSHFISQSQQANTQSSSIKQNLTIFKDFPQCNKIWYNQYLQNKINYLNIQNKIQMIDMCRLLQNKNIGKQWINLSYRFQALQHNQLYQELQDQFQVTAEESKDYNNNNDYNSIKNKINQFHDWSYCLISKQAILENKLKRLNCIEF